MSVCGATNILADDLLPNKTLRETISRIMELTASSTENAGSLVQVQDMESARHLPPKIPSPALSAASKDEPKQTPHTEHIADMKVDNSKEGDAANEGKVIDNVVHSSEKRTMKNTDRSDATPESICTKDPMSPVSARVPEESQEKLLGDDQGKKKKKKKTQLPGTDMQWRGFQDFGSENYAGMPLGPSAYNPYWGGGIPMGFDGFMPPFGGAMPYTGYVPSPFGRMMPPDPFAAQGYMMPAFPPRDLSEFGCNNMNMNKGPPMSREEFEAMKADIRRKYEREQLNEREHSMDGRHADKEASSSGADVSAMKAEPRLISKTERPDRSEISSDLDCHREFSCHSPLPPHPSRPPSKR